VDSYLMKPQSDVDLYVWWSTIIDGPVMWGTKADFLKKYKKRKWMFRFGEDFKQKIARADETGCSSTWTPAGEERNWGGYGTIAWENIPAALKIWETDLGMDMGDERLLWLVDKWEDDE